MSIAELPHAMPSGFDTRKDALSAIASARSWSELIDAGSRAMGSNREAWGDEFESCRQAAAIWSSLSFPVRCAPTIDISSTDGGPLKTISGPELSAESFKLAKIMASELCSFMDPARRAYFGSSPPKKSSLARALSRCADAMLKSEILLNLQKAPLQGAPAEFPASQRDHCALMIGLPGLLALIERNDEASAAMSALAQITSDEPWGSRSSWEQLSIACGAITLAPDSRRQAFERTEQSWDLAFASGGFAWLASGIQGGLPAMSNAALALEKACLDLGRAIGMPGRPVAGLGCLGASVNAPPLDPGTGASFNYRTWALDFYCGADAPALFHEWTHAFERLCLGATPADPDPFRAKAASALAALHQGLAILSPCPNAYDACIDAESSYFKNPRICALRVFARALRRNSEGDCSWPGEAARALRRAFIERARDEFKASNFKLHDDPIAHRAQAMRHWSDDARLPLNRHLVAMVEINNAVDSRLENFEKFRALGMSAFLARARVDEAGSQRKFGERAYHDSATELLARVGETSLSKAIGATSIATRDHPFAMASLPMGAEREQAFKLFFIWLDQARPLLKSALRAGAELPKLRASTPMSAFSKLVSKAAKLMAGNPKAPNHSIDAERESPPAPAFDPRKLFSNRKASSTAKPTLGPA